TRNPAGLTSALNKLRASGSQIEHPEAFVASHLFFGTDGEPVSDTSWASLLASHPPLEDRIRRLGGRLFSPRPGQEKTPQSPDLAAIEANQPQILAANPYAALPAMLPVAALPVVGAMEGIAGDLAPESVIQAQVLLASLPATLREKATLTTDASGIVCGLLFASQNDIRQQQEKMLPPAMLPAAQELYLWLSMQPEQGARYRLIWLDLALPTLRGATEDECQQLLDLAMALIRADGKISPTEFALYNILQSALLPPSERRINKSELRLEQLDSDIASLLALLAYAGHEDGEMAKAAYQTAIAASPASKELPFPDKKDFSLKTVSKAFSHLALTVPPYRKKILEACAVAAQHDGKITPVENELLRAFAQSLDCPAPLV
ncbi:MAG: hypothetical protein LBQ75_06275, partial [Zoogloeaceae bacterium]|nr:hypothetical protein [Zoogloeaceae bacterium]